MKQFQPISLSSRELPKFIHHLFETLQNVLVVKNGHIVMKKLQDISNEVLIDTYDNLIPNQLDLFLASEFVNDNELDDPLFQNAINNVNSGLFIRVPEKIVVSAQLHVIYVFDESNVSHNSRIILQNNSNLNLFEYVHVSKKGHFNFVSNSIVGDNAQLSYSAISNLQFGVEGVIRRNNYIFRNGKSILTLAQLSDGNIDERSNVFLRGENADGIVKTVAITSQKQEFEIRQWVVHQAPKTIGLIENYGVSNDESRLMFEGVGKIEKNMKRSKARQSNRGIVLGKYAKLEVNPLLLIDEYDVEAGHGAAIGKIDEEQLYYLMSRGLPIEMAERLIINGFLTPILEQLSTDALKEVFLTQVEGKTL